MSGPPPAVELSLEGDDCCTQYDKGDQQPHIMDITVGLESTIILSSLPTSLSIDNSGELYTSCQSHLA